MDQTGKVLRQTQRAPRSCLACAKRRIKCEKQIPCQQCVDRGDAASCQREVVMVRGQVTSKSPAGKAPSYQDLLDQNRRLKAAVTGHRTNRKSGLGDIVELSHEPESFETSLFRFEAKDRTRSTVKSLDDIVQCSQACSEALIAYGKQYVYWIHFAVYQPQFEREHASFWNPHMGNGLLQSQDAAWLAIYFAYCSTTLLLMESEVACEIGLPSIDTLSLVRNWYQAALYCLHEADYMRDPDVRNVQAIAILNIMFNNVGDGHLYPPIWAAAIRIAQALKLDRDDEQSGETLIQQQLRRRLWWTLTICEWLPLPHRNPCVMEGDFQVAHPAYLDDDELEDKQRSHHASRNQPRPVGYHVAMCRIASVFYRFRSLLRLGLWPRNELLEMVRKADEDLAVIISKLPPHLDPDENVNSCQLQKYPWIKDQRRHLMRVLLYRRIAINRILQVAWFKEPKVFAGPKAVCISSATALIHSIRQSDLPVERHRSAPFTTALFSAAIPLIFEARNCEGQERLQHLSGIDCALEMLRSVESFSTIAREAISTLESLTTNM